MEKNSWTKLSSSEVQQSKLFAFMSISVKFTKDTVIETSDFLKTRIQMFYHSYKPTEKKEANTWRQSTT